MNILALDTSMGACSGCPSSTATLRHGIENLLKHFIPEVQEVRPV
jgi:Fe-S cluster biogenesis protein NfuA